MLGICSEENKVSRGVYDCREICNIMLGAFMG